MKLTVATKVNAPVSEVWRAYTTPSDIVVWNAASEDWHTTSARLDLRKGGKFSSRMEAKDGSFGFDFEGTYTNVVENCLIEYTMGDRAATVSFEETRDGTAVTAVFDSEDSHSIEQQQQGWQAILDNFRRHVEASVDGGGEG